jgi:hypothetical protein
LSEPPVIPDFASGEEFAALMAGLAQRMHAKNRIWMGESGHAWMLAQLMTALGEEFRDAREDRDVAQDFGHAYHPARLDREAQLDCLLARLRARVGR